MRLLIAGGAVLTISFIYQLQIKEKSAAIKTAGVFGILIVAFSVYSIFLYIDYVTQDGDGFADDLKIPANIPINPVIDEIKRDSVNTSNKTQTDLQLYHSIQTGIYEYDFWTGKIESGTIYLKAFEITQGDALSASTLARNSEVIVLNTTNNLQRFTSEGHFTIYEGDWGKPYAARFEVWLAPENNDPERKLFEKKFKIEGWMR